MPDQLQLRGGTTVQHSTFTGVSKEVTVDTTKKTAVVHDGSTVGGNPLMREDASNSALALASAGTPSLKFSGDPNTGIYSPGADQLAITTGGTSRLAVSTTAVSSTLAVDHPLGAVGTPSITFTGDLNTGLFSPGADTVALVTGGTNRVHVTSGGLVGLGTSSPGTTFHVAQSGAAGVGGHIKIQNTSARASGGEFAQLSFGPNSDYSGSTIGAFIRALDPSGNANNFCDLIVGTGSSGSPAERLRITSAGLVGIGTTSPTDSLSYGTALDIRGSTPSNGGVIYLRNSDASATGFIGGYTGGCDLGTSTSHPLKFYTVSSERARIDSSGRLLVGTSTSSMSGGTVQQNGNLGIIANNATNVSNNGTLDIVINSGGGCYSGFLIVENTLVASAATRTQATYSVLGRGTSATATSIATLNGSTAAASFTLTYPSNGTIRITNTCGGVTNVNLVWFGPTGY